MDQNFTPKQDWYITECDIVNRLLRIRPYWMHGAPKVYLEGEEKTFGKLIFDFHDGSPVCYQVYIVDKDRLLGVAEQAIVNFSELATWIYESG